MRLRNYSAKPAPKFRGEGKFFVGVELEVEAPDYDAKNAGLEAAGVRPWYYYAKRDSSLGSNGWELISHPFSRELWLDHTPTQGPANKFFHFVKVLKDKFLYTSHDNGRCGLHLHVSREVFDLRKSGYAVNPLKSTHYYWFCRLINGPLFKKLSQRKTDGMSYCKQVPVKVKTFAASGDRHRAVNPTSRTVEVRIFRGNLKEDRIRKAIEAVIAAVEFTKDRDLCSSKNFKQEVLERNFIRFVANNRTRFPNLLAYINQIKLAEGNNSERNEEELVACV